MLTTLAFKAELLSTKVLLPLAKDDEQKEEQGGGGGGGTYNPLEGVTPNIDVFGVKFTNAITLILGGAWALALLVAVFFILKNAAAWSAARKRGMSDDMTDGADGLKRSSLAFAVTAGAGVIVGAILALVGLL